jgi:hypothetical protein
MTRRWECLCAVVLLVVTPQESAAQTQIQGTVFSAGVGLVPNATVVVERQEGVHVVRHDAEAWRSGVVSNSREKIFSEVVRLPGANALDGQERVEGDGA